MMNLKMKQIFAGKKNFLTRPVFRIYCLSLLAYQTQVSIAQLAIVSLTSALFT